MEELSFGKAYVFYPDVALRGLEREGIRHVFKLPSPEDVESTTIGRQPLWNNRKAEHGPLDLCFRQQRSRNPHQEALREEREWK